MKLPAPARRVFPALLFLTASVFWPLTPLAARTLIETGSTGQARYLVPNPDGSSAHFRREFEGAGLGPGEHLVLLIMAPHGAIVSVNGTEIGRPNWIDSSASPGAKPAPTPAYGAKLVYHRLRIPDGLVRSDRPNVIEADVHPSVSHPGYFLFGLGLKTLPPKRIAPEPDGNARRVLETFRKTSYLGPGVSIPDGYIDGGHGMVLDFDDHAKSGREILLVDRKQDAELDRYLDYARSLRALPEAERARRVADYIVKLATAPSGSGWAGGTLEEFTKEFANQTVCIGDVIEQCHAGVCRHRSLLFKLLADEAGLNAALVRGDFRKGSIDGPHAWNELTYGDGRRLLVDITQHPNEDFRAVRDPEVVQSYLKLDRSPLYRLQ